MIKIDDIMVHHSFISTYQVLCSKLRGSIYRLRSSDPLFQRQYYPDPWLLGTDRQGFYHTFLHLQIRATHTSNSRVSQTPIQTQKQENGGMQSRTSIAWNRHKNLAISVQNGSQRSCVLAIYYLVMFVPIIDDFMPFLSIV